LNFCLRYPFVVSPSTVLRTCLSNHERIFSHLPFFNGGSKTPAGRIYEVMSWARVLLCAFFFFALFLGAASCAAQPRVVISTNAGKELSVRVEVADTPAKRAQGLMYRNDLPEEQGMLFLFPAATNQTFWMKNTPLSLDLMFIGSDLRIVGIVERATPFSTDSLSVSAPSQFVLEVRGGFCQRHGIKVGDAVRFDGISLEGIKG